ncbi:MAG: hypothetical protein WC047_08745 [Kiritimatiellales bacterium]
MENEETQTPAEETAIPASEETPEGASTESTPEESSDAPAQEEGEESVA